MRTRDIMVGFCVGLLFGLVMAVGSLNDRLLPRARAQAVQAEVPRFQLRTWAYPGFEGRTLGERASYGAYVLETVTGKLWLSAEGQPLKPAGQAK